MKKLMTEWRQHIAEQEGRGRFPFIVKYLQLSTAGKHAEADEVLRKHAKYVQNFIAELTSATKRSPEESAQLAQKLAGQKQAGGGKTGIQLFGKGARCPKCVYTQKGEQYFINGKPANPQQSAQIKKALAR